LLIEKWFEAHFHHARVRVIAALNRKFADLDLADEAFSIACIKALAVWQVQGKPDDPVAWLVRCGSNAGIDILRRESSAIKYQNGLVESQNQDIYSNPSLASFDDDELGDDVLRLMFVCCHPQLNTQSQLALSLKIIVGMSIEEIASAFIVKSKSMEQRITRAKKRVNKANIAFETPSIDERLKRLKAVSLMLYLLFNEGWYATAGEGVVKALLCEQAIRLARELLSLFPAQSELMSLLALFLFHYAKRHARLNDNGELVALDEQTRELWDQEMIAEGCSLMNKAMRHPALGAYQIQAAIAQVHVSAKHAADTNWLEIRRLYDHLLLLEPNPVISLNRAAVSAKIEGPYKALIEINKLAQVLDSYRWFHTLKAELLTLSERPEQAIKCYEKALKLAPTQLEITHIIKKMALLKN